MSLGKNIEFMAHLENQLLRDINCCIDSFNFIYIGNYNDSDIKLIVKVDYLVFVCLPILQKNVIKVIWEMAANEIGK